MTFEASTPVLVVDPSSGGQSTRDRFTWCAARWCVDTSKRYLCRGDGEPVRSPISGEPLDNPDWNPERPYLRVSHVGWLDGGFFGAVNGDQIADDLKRLAQDVGARTVHTDQRESLFLSASLQRRGLRCVVHTWTGPSKTKAVELVRRWLIDSVLELPADAEHLKQELLAFEETSTPSGSLTFGARRGGHDDFVALLITLAHAEIDGGLPASPYTSQGPERGPIPDRLAAMLG